MPIIDGKYQKEGRDHFADASFANGIFTVEFHRAYDIPTLEQLTRTFSFTEDTITLQDEYVFHGEPLPIVERFISRYPAEITPAGVMTGGILMETKEKAEITETEGLFCIDYILPPGADRFTLTVRI